jgi:anaerobic ribonucleoside-triphosphate reductase activating protein
MDVNINGIIHDSIVDGLGLRTVIFFQGCYHNCYNCHNKDTHNTNIKNKIKNTELIKMIKDNKRIKSVTISGGEPFIQYPALLEIVKSLKDYNIWIYSGYTKKELIELGYDEVFKYIDVLVDGKYIDEQRTLDYPFIGSHNQEIHYFKNKR